MITFYAKEAKGDVCEVKLKDLDYVNLTLIGFRESEHELGYKYTIISKEEYKKLKGKKRGRKTELPSMEPGEYSTVGYYLQTVKNGHKKHT